MLCMCMYACIESDVDDRHIPCIIVDGKDDPVQVCAHLTKSKLILETCPASSSPSCLNVPYLSFMFVKFHMNADSLCGTTVHALICQEVPFVSTSVQTLFFACGLSNSCFAFHVVPGLCISILLYSLR